MSSAPTLPGPAAAAPASSRPAASTRRPRRLRILGVAGAAFAACCVAVGIGAPLPYLVTSWDTLAAADHGLAAHYLGQPAPIRAALVAHAAFAGLALVLTPFQRATGPRDHWQALHRWSGRILVLAIIAGAGSGLVVAQVSYAGWSGRIGFSALAVTWLYAARRTVAAARQGDLAAHRRWAQRVMALTFAAVTLRMWTGLWIVLCRPDSTEEARTAFDQIYPYVPFISWIPNLTVVEWSLRRDRSHRTLRGAS